MQTLINFINENEDEEFCFIKEEDIELIKEGKKPLDARTLKLMRKFANYGKKNLEKRGLFWTTVHLKNGKTFKVLVQQRRNPKTITEPLGTTKSGKEKTRTYKKDTAVVVGGALRGSEYDPDDHWNLFGNEKDDGFARHYDDALRKLQSKKSLRSLPDKTKDVLERFLRALWNGEGHVPAGLYHKAYFIDKKTGEAKYRKGLKRRNKMKDVDKENKG